MVTSLTLTRVLTGTLNKTSQSYEETTEDKLSRTGLRLAMRHPKYHLFDMTKGANKTVLQFKLQLIQQIEA